MTTETHFKKVVFAINNAIENAQNTLNRHQKKLVDTYLENDGSLKMKDVIIKKENGKEKIYQLPLVYVMPPEALQIKDLKVQLDVPLDEDENINETKNSNINTENTDKIKEYKSMHIEMKFESNTPNTIIEKIEEAIWKSF